MASSAPRPPETPGDFNATLDNQPERNATVANMKSTGRRPASLPPGELSRPTGTQRKRASYHQDVEEALSSLLWQPYEYRTQSDSSDTLSTLSLSTGSSSSTSLSYEYATISKNVVHSFTDEFLNMASVYGNTADPNQMVSNLLVLDAGSVGRQADRGSALSQVDAASSRVREFVLKCSRGAGSVSDEAQVSASDMRVEIPAAAAAISSDLIPSNITSVVSANVVGLPVHSRSSSTLSTRSVTDQANVFPLHFRTNSNANRHSAVSVQHVRANSDSTPNILHTRQESQPQAQPQPSRVPPLPNVSNVNVNFYRAVPVNVVSNVPTIQCVNSVEETVGNNVSNVHIVQAMPPPSIPTQQVVVPVSTVTEVRTRTFTSTEAQTDDTTVGTIVVPSVNREQRRRERRERRHQRRVNSSNHPHPQQSQPQQQNVQHQQQQHPQWPSQGNDRLPDLLNNHLPPPYSTLPSGVPPPMAMVAPPPPPPGTMVPFPPGVVPVVQAPPPPVPVPVAVPQPPTGFRFPFPNANGFRRCRSRLGPRYSTEEHQPKSCCGFLVSRPGSLRWFIALIALVAVCCVLVGTVLGAMRPAGRDHLTVSLLMIGVGIVLVTVSGVAWRLTSHDAPSCRAMLGLDSSDSADVCTRRFVPRLPPSYGRPHHPYAAMIYPEFQYRPPPPSYQASMQEYRLRLLLLDRAGSQQQAPQHAVSPPPTYRSHAGSLLRAPLSNRRDATQSEYSCPPSYRSRSSSNRQPSVGPVAHSREQSLSLSESNQDGSVVNVVSILANQEEEIALENMTLDSLKVAPENEIPPLRMLLKSSSGSDLDAKDGNLVTIVQKADQNPVIVTVSGSQMSTTNPEVGSSNQIPSEMEILAHL